MIAWYHPARARPTEPVVDTGAWVKPSSRPMSNPTVTARRLATFGLALLFVVGLGTSRARAATDIGISVGSKAVTGPSSPLTYWITTFNTGSGAATNVTLSAIMPPHVVSVSFAFNGFTACPIFTQAQMTCTAASLPANTQLTPLLTVSTDSTIPNGSVIDLTLTVSSPDDTTPLNNSITVRTKVVSGPATAGVFRRGAWYLNNQNDGSAPEFAFSYGITGDVPVVGDWNCSGNQTVGVFRNGAWYLNNENDGSGPEAAFNFGQAGDIPVVGDWDGDGCDGVGVFRNGQWILSNQASGTRPFG